MNTRKVEILEESIKEGVITRTKGDIVSLPHDLATAYINAGLAKDAVTGEVGERVAGTVPLKVEITSIVTKMG